MGEFILGYDARVSFDDTSRTWSCDCRDEYLLRGDVEVPLSVDSTVWPEFFASNGIAKPLWTGPFGLWELASLRSALAQRQFEGSPYRVIRICVLPKNREQVEWWRPRGKLEAAAEIAAGEAAQNLGFDVADGWLVSAIANCAFTPAEHFEGQQRWAHLLNQHHLFDSLDSASDFADWSDARVSEHRPFFVYRIGLMVE